MQYAIVVYGNKGVDGVITQQFLTLFVILLALTQSPALAQSSSQKSDQVEAGILAEIKRLEAADQEAFEAGDYVTGLKISDQLVPLVVKHLGEQSEKYASVTNDRATILEELDRSDEALTLYEQSWNL